MFILGIIVGAIFGVMILAICMASKEYDYSDNFKVEIYKSGLVKIIESDIKFYTKMYNVNKNNYYKGRIEQCKFIKDIITGGN